MWSTIAPPLSINYVGSSVRNAGYNTKIMDYNVILKHEYEKSKKNSDPDIWNGSYAHEWSHPQTFQSFIFPLIQTHAEKYCLEIIETLVKEKIDIIGFTAYSSSVNFTHYVIEKIKESLPTVKIILGGPETARGNSIEFLFDKKIDAIIQNEGEETILTVIKTWEKNENVARIPGVQALDENENLLPVGIAKTINMENLPVLNFEDFQLHLYEENILPIMMSRGCVALCTFCDEPNYWGRFRWRSAEHIFEEMKENSEKYGMNFFQSMDSLLNGHQRNFKKLAELIIEHKLSIEFAGNVRISKHMDSSLFKNLKKAGCRYLVFGLECGSQRILDMMKKNIKLEWAIQNFKDCFNCKIEVHANLIVGFPGETEEDFQDTLKFLDKVLQYITCINMGVGMCIGHGQDVFINPKKYDVKLDSNDDVYFDESGNWESRDGFSNTIEIRQDRIYRLRKFLRDYDVIVNPYADIQ